MLVKEKFYRITLKKKLFFLLNFFLIYQLSINASFADIQKNLIGKLEETKTLTFNFKQKIAEKDETGICFIKYPFLMKCNYKNIKQKTIISNGQTLAIIKKKYKKIYYYPIKTTPLFTILDKKKIISLIKNNKPTKIELDLIEFEFIDKKSNKLIIFFDKNTLQLKGWKTKDVYSNEVSFTISDLKINNQILDNFFKIPKEEDL